MAYEDKVYDANGERIIKGSRVKVEWHDDDIHRWFGTVDHVSDSDGDTDDEGRLYGINPKVFVQWDPGFADDDDLEGFSTSSYGGYHEDQWYECDELEVVK